MPVDFNSASRDFDPAFSADGAHVYFCSDRPGGHGGDDLYRVLVTAEGFGQPENLGPDVNSEGNEFAPMLAADASALLFSSDRAGGAGKQDLYLARRAGAGFEPAQPVAGGINTPGDEFDATFLADNATIVLAAGAASARIVVNQRGRVRLGSGRTPAAHWPRCWWPSSSPRSPPARSPQ